MSKLWGGRFQGRLLPELERFSSSLEVDVKLSEFDIAGSIAHARGLLAAGLITQAQLESIEAGLGAIRSELAAGDFEFKESDEDIHTAVERRLTEIDADAGGRLHTGRSRNDQVALDLRLYCREAASRLAAGLAQVLAVLSERSAFYAAVPMPGYTHLQRAQVVTAGHHLLAHAEPLRRDVGRVMTAYSSADEMPLGSGALAGSTLPLQREVVAAALGMGRLSQNSMDAVSDRDFALDLLYACLSIGIHLSRLAEDFVIWSSAEFGFVQLADEIATGSSLMPQKKNPDIAELLRGRTGRSLGSLVALATVLKGLPLSYDRDLQEDKVALFAGVENAVECLEAASHLAERLRFDEQRLLAVLQDPGLYATDTAERMVTEGIPFREAHLLVGRMVREGTHVAAGGPAASLQARDMVGGPHPLRVRRRARAIAREAARTLAWSQAHPPPLP